MATHFIVTNRQVRTGTGGKDFLKVNDTEYIRTDGEEEAMDNLRYGEVHFDPKKADKLRDFDLRLYPDLTDDQMRDLALFNEAPKNRKIPSLKVYETLHAKGKSAKKDAHILVFVHGFNNDLEGSLTTLAELHRLYVEPKESPIEHIVIYSWPARSNLLRYRDDARDAVKSGYAMARAFQSMTGFFLKLIRDAQRANEDPADALCGQKIHLMCHSMGNRVFESMMVELRRSTKRPNSVFGEILLMAADVDDDSLEPEKPLADAIMLGERMHIYYHNSDQALGISEKTKNAFNRLGRWGARRTVPLPDAVIQADVSYISDDRTLREKVAHHWYYLNSTSVVKDVTEVLNGKTTVFQY